MEESVGLCLDHHNPHTWIVVLDHYTFHRSVIDLPCSADGPALLLRHLLAIFLLVVLLVLFFFVLFLFYISFSSSTTHQRINAATFLLAQHPRGLRGPVQEGRA
jgi:hypothetical protein